MQLFCLGWRVDTISGERAKREQGYCLVLGGRYCGNVEELSRDGNPEHALRSLTDLLVPTKLTR